MAYVHTTLKTLRTKESRDEILRMLMITSNEFISVTEVMKHGITTAVVLNRNFIVQIESDEVD
jgi:hypothetical protein